MALIRGGTPPFANRTPPPPLNDAVMFESATGLRGCESITSSLLDPDVESVVANCTDMITLPLIKLYLARCALKAILVVPYFSTGTYVKNVLFMENVD